MICQYNWCRGSDGDASSALMWDPRYPCDAQVTWERKRGRGREVRGDGGWEGREEREEGGKERREDVK